jgi:hypothetical protein
MGLQAAHAVARQQQQQQQSRSMAAVKKKTRTSSQLTAKSQNELFFCVDFCRIHCCLCAVSSASSSCFCVNSIQSFECVTLFSPVGNLECPDHLPGHPKKRLKARLQCNHQLLARRLAQDHADWGYLEDSQAAAAVAHC